MSVDYWEAWSLWCSGQTNPDQRMSLIWEWPLLYWGRLGKLLQFTGGLVIVFDLIGSERLRRLEGRTRLTASKVLKIGKTLASRKTEPRDPLVREWKDATIGARILLIVVVGAVLTVTLLHISSDLRPRFDNDFLANFIYGTIVAMVATFVTQGILLVLHIPIRALAWIFRSDRPGHPTRWIAFILAVAGFQFDLLAS